MSASCRFVLAAIAIAALQTGCTSEHTQVVKGTCPAWVNYPTDIHSNDGSPYLGCDNQANLEQMLVDKRDLTKGRKLDPADGALQAKAVQDYKEGKTKSSKSNAPTGAALLLQNSSTTGSSAQ